MGQRIRSPVRQFDRPSEQPTLAQQFDDSPDCPFPERGQNGDSGCLLVASSDDGEHLIVRGAVDECTSTA
jgi:hypothetical protein